VNARVFSEGYRMSDSKLTSHFGYIFYPSEQHNRPGHPRLDVFIHPKPTYEHFDPEEVSLTVVQARDSCENLGVVHPWNAKTDYQVFPGLITVRDRLHQTISAFTFGADLHIHSDENLTACEFTSMVPILSFHIPETLDFILAQEVEILLAELRARWIDHLDLMESRLAQAPPIALYATCLDILREKFASGLQAQDELTQSFYHFLINESQSLSENQGMSARDPNLDQLFAGDVDF
jgi:hypothetical protein